MAMVEFPRPRPAIGIRCPEFSSMRQISRARSEIVARTPQSPVVNDDILFVALGKEAKESAPVLNWAVLNSKGRRICILHVHQPAQKMPIMGTKMSISLLEEGQVTAFHEEGRKEMIKILDKYVQTCKQAGVQAEKLYIEMDSIEKGIVKLVSKHGINSLVMGTTSFSRKTREPKSKKAMHVRTEAPAACHISFICKGVLTLTRESNLGENSVEVELTTLPATASPNICTGMPLCSHSVNEGQMMTRHCRSSSWDHRGVRSDNNVIQLLAANNDDASTPFSLDQKGNNDRNWSSRRSPSIRSQLCSHSEIPSGLSRFACIQSPGSEGSEIQLESSMLQQSDRNHHRVSSVASSVDESMDDQLYDRLEQFVAEAENSNREAFRESVRRKKAEKDAIDVIRKIKATEVMYAEELRRRKENEEALARGFEEFEKIKCELVEVKEELRVAQEQKSLMERQLLDSKKTAHELEQKIHSAVAMLTKYKKERDELLVERNNALRVAQDLRRAQTREASSSSASQFFSKFCFSEIKEATNNFSEDLKIGEGGYGSIFKGNLRHTEVAIKMLRPNSSQGPSEFQQEVNILSKLRHPNLVNLIGACTDGWALIYEYLPNGSLSDRLHCKDNATPLSWQTRIRIAAELCSALIFLHSCKPQPVVHGDLKPANVLLDSNFTSKLSDFGMCRVLYRDESSESKSEYWRTEPKGTLTYIDPEFMSTGELTAKSDVFSFGIILLRLLTGRSAMGIRREVQYALDKGKFKDLLDPTAGDWPYVWAEQLAHLALRCSNEKRMHRPDLASEVLNVLISMRASSGLSSFRFGSGEHGQFPAYFACPILQEIMQDPVVAADGYTYESEAIKTWLNDGHDTSPMTNVELPHSNLIPNLALRSAIQEWLQHP